MQPTQQDLTTHILSLGLSVPMCTMGEGWQVPKERKEKLSEVSGEVLTKRNGRGDNGAYSWG